MLRAELNVNDLSALRKYIIKIKPKWIINAIAYTNVDMAEKEQKMAHILNVEGIQTSILDLITSFLYYKTKSVESTKSLL